MARKNVRFFRSEFLTTAQSTLETTGRMSNIRVF